MLPAMLRALAFLSLLCLPSCFLARSTENEPLRYAEIESLQPGTTTDRQVVERLGSPADVVQLGKRSAYLYRHGKTKRAGLFLVLLGLYNEDTRSDRLWVFFDEAGLLTHYGATLAAHHTQYAMPWNDIHDPADAREWDRERRDDQAAAGK
jgi:outer membrane protein assembly factor BamE (lipoprotein component of BamABCDE complex)